jgi:hypothetical protein
VAVSIAASLGNELGVEFIVLLAPTALPTRQLLGLAHELAALDAGTSPPAAAGAREDLLAAIAIIESEPDPLRARERLTAFSESLADRRRRELAPLTLALSPDTGWGNKWLFAREKEFRKAHPALKNRV